MDIDFVLIIKFYEKDRVGRKKVVDNSFMKE